MAKKVNPFDKGVTYEAFLKAIPKNTKVETYLKDICSDEQIEFILKELELVEKLKTKK